MGAGRYPAALVRSASAQKPPEIFAPIPDSKSGVITPIANSAAKTECLLLPILLQTSGNNLSQFADVPRKGNVDRNKSQESQRGNPQKTFPLRGTRIEMPGALNRRLYLRRCYLVGAELNMGVICSKRPGVFSGPFVRIFRCFSLRRNPHLWLPRRCGPQPRRLLSARRCWAARI